MIYRKIKASEFHELRKLQCNVYFMKYEKDKPSTNPEMDDIRIQGARAAFTDDGKMAATLEMIPFYAYFDGHRIKSPGIAGVATLLEHRRSGYVKTLLKKAYEEMSDHGAVMSYLYPFSHEYYMKYGYAQAGYANTIKTDITNVVKSSCKGYTKQFFPGDSFDDLKYIYDRFAKQYNCCIARDDWRWKRLFSKDPHTEKVRAFIRYSQDGEPVAYIKMSAKHVADYTNDMLVHEMAYHGENGVQGLLAIINGFTQDLRKIIMVVPTGFPIELVTREVWELEVTRNHIGMNRIISAKKALELMKKPAVSGSVVISVDDEHAPWNSGKWLVAWGSESKVEKTDAPADLECRISSLSQLVTGYMTLKEAINVSDVKILNNRELLESLFIKKPCFIWDHF